MYSGVMFVLAVAAFAWGVSLASYRWVALQNAWPLGAWHAERPMVPCLIGLGAIVVALVAGVWMGGATIVPVILLGLAGAVVWTAQLKVAAQSALVLAPVAAVLLLAGWLFGG
jgi:hypothetical protein